MNYESLYPPPLSSGAVFPAACDALEGYELWGPFSSPASSFALPPPPRLKKLPRKVRAALLAKRLSSSFGDVGYGLVIILHF